MNVNELVLQIIKMPPADQFDLAFKVAENVGCVISRVVTPAVCQTCGGKHIVGGFVSADSGYQTDPCPDCAGGGREALINQIAEYLDDAPHGGGHSDIAGANCWELLEEAMQALRNSK